MSYDSHKCLTVQGTGRLKLIAALVMTCVIIVASKDKTIALCDILYLFSKIFSVISRFQLVALEYTKLAAAFHNNHVK